MSDEDEKILGEYFTPPHKEEIVEIAKELKKAIDRKDYPCAIEQLDKGYNLAFGTSLIHARRVSELREMLEEGELEKLSKQDNLSPEEVEEARKIIRELIGFETERYQKITEAMKKLQELQQKYRLTDAPVG